MAMLGETVALGASTRSCTIRKNDDGNQLCIMIVDGRVKVHIRTEHIEQLFKILVSGLADSRKRYFAAPASRHLQELVDDDENKIKVDSLLNKPGTFTRQLLLEALLSTGCRHIIVEIYGFKGRLCDLNITLALMENKLGFMYEIDLAIELWDINLEDVLYRQLPPLDPRTPDGGEDTGRYFLVFRQNLNGCAWQLDLILSYFTLSYRTYII